MSDTAHRALRTLSAGNRALLRANEENELLREMCRVIVEVGGYRMAWVGYAQQDAGKTIRPMAHAGYEKGHLETRTFTWADNEQGNTTAARAIRSARPCVGRKLLSDPDVEPRWRDEARKRGFASVSSFPLLLDGEVLGNLTIYAEEPDAFDSGEVELLGELAENLAFGIRALRVRAERDRSQRELLRVDRARRTLSAGNRTLLRANDEQPLLQDMCRTAVDVGGYRMAWVGYAEHDAAQTIRPMAFAGHEDGLFANAHFTWADSENGHGPSGTAIRTGRPCVGRNLLTDPTPAPWHAECLQRGYAAASAFPLRVDNQVIGSLAIVAGEADAFGDAEIEVLAEMADDLAFGIGALRVRKQHEQAQETIRHMGFYDRLTGLPNRARLTARLEETITTSKQKNRPFVLMVVGVDRFREVNESLGYRQGDLLLQEIARRLVDIVGQGDAVARLGEAEFGVLLPQGDAAMATRTAHLIRAALYPPVDVSGLMLDARTSIGIALFPGHGTEPEALLRRANLAMQQARQSGHGFAIYTGGLEKECSRRLELMGDLHRAIDSDELRLYCQPKVHLGTGLICGAEALVRWEHPQLGMISPGEFIGLAERSGLINPLTDWVMHAAFRQSYAWHEQGLAVPLAVNLSARDLRDPTLEERVRGLFATWGAEPDWMQFELTESALMEDPRASLERLTRLKDVGSELFIDDFGTGYSSLSYLQKLPVDAIKIDRSFVEEMLTDHDSEVIVRSTIDLAHDLELQVVAEGVENQAFWDHLTAQGCDVAQGYAITRPIPAEDFRNWQAQCRWRV